MLVKKDVTRDYGGSEAEMDLISSLAKSLSVNTSGEMDSLRDVLYPSLLCAAVYKVDTKISISTLTFVENINNPDLSALLVCNLKRGGVPSKVRIFFATILTILK